MTCAVANLLIQIEAAWWLAFFGVFGLCVGSFLNVVIFRLPNDISLRSPLWSFCPQCARRIRWYDNLPVLSYILLRGRCRDCQCRIAPRYMVVELATALVVLLLFDAFFVAGSHRGIAVDWPGLSWPLSQNWPILLAHIILFTALLAMSAIDLAHYWVDVRFTTIATAAGFALHAIWSGQPNPTSYASSGMRSGALVATVTLIIVLGISRLLRRPHMTGDETETLPPNDSETVVADPAISPDALDAADNPALESDPTIPPTVEQVHFPAPPGDPAGNAPPGPEPVGVEGDSHPKTPSTKPDFGRLVGFLLAAAAAAVLIAVVITAWSDAAERDVSWSAPARWWPAFALLFLLILVAGAPSRATDDEIIEAIEAERSGARIMVLGEIAWLLPVILLGGITLYYGVGCSQTKAMFADVLRWSPRQGWHPLEGLGMAATGFVVGGAIGWLVRWVATLTLGKEAFGTGDIHMMAAAGCVAGWEVVLVGFMLCSFLALAGWILTLPFKRVHAIPLGPWLSIAFLLVVVMYDWILGSTMIRDALEAYRELLVSKR